MPGRHSVLILLFCVLKSARGIVSGRQAVESYYRFIGDYPSDVNPGWHEDVQGVAHDESNWFITQAHVTETTEKALWKIPVTYDLAEEVFPGTPGVQRRLIRDIPVLYNAGYTHFGDLDYFKYRGHEFLLVPMEFGDKAIALFRSTDLEYLSIDFLPQSDAPWCVLDPQGNLYSSNFEDVTSILKYTIDWDKVVDSNKFILSAPAPISLGGATLQDVQGGEITLSGELLYLVANGIYVFNLLTNQIIRQSSNGTGMFTYEFDPRCDPTHPVCEEPEGLTIWDLEDGRAPGIRGQLHVFLLDNDSPDDDDVYFKHYTNVIYADVNGSLLGNGTYGNPFPLISTANAFAWDGTRIVMSPGTYPEALTLSKRMTIESTGGVVTIGE